MAHTIKGKSKLLARVRRIRGQVEAIERGLETDIGCADILQLVASVRGAVNGLTAELIEDHIKNHVVEALTEAERRAAADELIAVIRSYMK
jgi:FrmR/RcnR family transcriptional regulator, repressor of rcnA expression